MERQPNLYSWLEGHSDLSGFGQMVAPFMEYGGFVTLDVAVPLHQTVELQPESLGVAWKKAKEFVDRALVLVDMDEPMGLDKEESLMIREALGEPPSGARPLYLISVGDGENERIVYIGKTASNTARFRGGHPAITRLHDPKYDTLSKRVYLGQVMLLSAEKDYLPLEWIQPTALGDEILSSIEAQLIHHLQPELNTQHRRHNNAKWPVSLHIQNCVDGSNILDGKFSWG